MRARLGNKCKILPGGIVDSQHVQAPGAPAQGCSANQNVIGPKPQVAIDTSGHRQAVNLQAADMGDS